VVAQDGLVPLHAFLDRHAPYQIHVSTIHIMSCKVDSLVHLLDYSQCLPGAPPSTPPPGSGSAIPFLGGVNTAGYDFSVATDGSFTGTGVSPPPSQYAHFVAQGANLFRIRESLIYICVVLSAMLICFQLSVRIICCSPSDFDE
jgi:hypothetical protein